MGEFMISFACYNLCLPSHEWQAQSPCAPTDGNHEWQEIASFFRMTARSLSKQSVHPHLSSVYYLFTVMLKFSSHLLTTVESSWVCEFLLLPAKPILLIIKTTSQWEDHGKKSLPGPYKVASRVSIRERNSGLIGKGWDGLFM